MYTLPPSLPLPNAFVQVYKIRCASPPIEYISITKQLAIPTSLSFLCYAVIWFVIMFTKVPASREWSVYICLRATFVSYFLIKPVFLRATELIDPVPIPCRLQTVLKLMWWLELTKISSLVDTVNPFNTMARFDLIVAMEIRM